MLGYRFYLVESLYFSERVLSGQSSFSLLSFKIIEICKDKFIVHNSNRMTYDVDGGVALHLPSVSLVHKPGYAPSQITTAFF